MIPDKSRYCEYSTHHSFNFGELVTGAMQDLVAQPGVVSLAERGQDHRLGELGADEALALEHGPHRRVAQAGRVARGNHRLAEMKMIAVRIGQFGDREPARLVLRGRFPGESAQLLQQGQGFELQRVEIERVAFRRHSA
jgi:hypothetical protein